MVKMTQEMRAISLMCLNCKHEKISHLRPISNQNGRMNKTYGTCKQCKKEGKEKVCHVFRTKNSKF